VLKTMILLALGGTAAWGASQTFDFKDPKGVNNATFRLDAPLEAISGSASGVAGKVTYDPENPAATKGTITVTANSLHVPNPVMKGHLHSGMWLDVDHFPNITFEVRELRNVQTAGTTCSADAVGTLTLHGVSKEMTFPVKLAFLKDKLGQRVPDLKGDLLVIRAAFSIKRADFGINPQAPEEKVSNTIELALSIAGASPR
jgi:polyisoprenoid-binding protein YceI